MLEEADARFDGAAQAWKDYVQSPLGRIRHEVTWHNLAPHLPVIPAADPPYRVLDAGGGSGELALALVQRGYQVWLLDRAPAMLDQARQAARALPEASEARLHLCEMDAEQAPQAFAPGFFDAITCHTLIEYLPQPRLILQGLAGLLCDGGLLSLSFVTRHGQVLRQVWSRADPAGALRRFDDGTFCASLFDVSGMAYEEEEISAWLASIGLVVTASYGIRAFADFVPRERLADPEFFDALLRLEKTAAARAPYRWMSRYAHLLARKG